MFTPLPPEVDEREYRIVRAGPKHPMFFIARNEVFTGVMTHRWSEKTRLCSKSDSCMACKIGSEKRWQGYIFGQCPKTGSVATVHITSHAADQLKMFAAGKPIRLYGHLIMLQRHGGRKGKVYATILEPKDCGPMLTQEALEARVRSVYKTVGTCCSPEVQTR